ncbi:DUF3800 domain-containing protein [Williamsia sp. 1135]|uniref:DUF3800 domain-containing protein n=1 Tax=Williamsia sp. 1135 TaxID=1889262 RepID=UPI001439DCF1|nr:DUF3800 domain-containing protein [Williamsia sp. 1135]
MYLLFADESGTHGGSHAFVLGGIAIHEDDTAKLQTALDQLVIEHLGKVPINLEEYELHASELRNAKKPKMAGRTNQPSSVWAFEDRKMRLSLLDAAYQAVVDFVPNNVECPPVYFGVVVDNDFHSDWTAQEREQFAYEVLLNKFDVMLKRLRVDKGLPNKGLVIHDRRVLAERDIQSWTAGWRLAAGRVGQVRNLADVPLFADSRASRLLQVADLVAYSLYRRYDPQRLETKHFAALWSSFAEGSRELHGCVHYTPNYGSGSCLCEPCSARMEIEQSSDSVKRKRRKTPR